MDPKGRDQLRMALQCLVYAEHEAWLLDTVVIEPREKQLLSPRVLHDIEYVEKKNFGLRKETNDDFFIDVDTEEHQRLRYLCTRLQRLWEHWYPQASEDKSRSSHKTRRAELSLAKKHLLNPRASEVPSFKERRLKN